VAEAIKLYQRHPRQALAIGLLPGIWDAVLAGAHFSFAAGFAFQEAGAPFFTGSYLYACAVVAGTSLRAPTVKRAFLVGLLVYLPFPVLTHIYVVPGIAWFAFLGLSVPAALIEGRSFGDSLARGYQLARADVVHMVAGLVTLIFVVVLSQLVVFQLLRGFAGNAALTASALAGVALSPILFLGAAVLYVDQAARSSLRSR
jgi:hypothetical protein